LEFESLRALSETFRLEFKLPTFTNPHYFEFKFKHESEIPKRISVVIGKNGSGKSQTLRHFVKYLLKRNHHLTAGDGERPIVGRVLAFSGPGETSKTFPRKPRKANTDYNHITLGQIRTARLRSTFGEIILRLLRSDESIKGTNRWELFCNTIKVVCPLDELVLKFLPNDNVSTFGNVRVEEIHPLSEMRRSREAPQIAIWANIDLSAGIYRRVGNRVVPLSSGQLTFIRFAAYACLHIENGTIVLFDEPETHLHPNFISRFIRLLDRLLEETGSFAVLATHSAYVVREVPQTQVFVIRQQPLGEAEISSPRFKTLGADIGAISFFVFGDELHGDLLREVQNRLQRSRKPMETVLGEIESELSPEAVMYLRRELLRLK
jgi:energy-coupling factor transporter ATP-binding protein EcfA2